MISRVDRGGNGQSVFAPPFFRIFIPFGLAYFMSIMLGSANAIMSRILVEEFHLSSYDLGAMSSAYLLSFGAAQIPLGIMLDRLGPRKSLFPLLMIASAGCLLFSRAGGFFSLTLSRALMGIGFCGCLMGPYKAFADWIDAGKLPVAYSLQALVGGIGGIAATKPLALAFEAVAWRDIFVIFSIAIAAMAVVIRAAAPPKKPRKTEEAVSLARQFCAMAGFLGDARFWRIAPVLITTQGVLFTYLYLWLGPWMRDVAKFPENSVEFYMMTASVGSAAGYFLNGMLADWLKKREILSWSGLYLCSGLILTVSLGVIAFFNDRSVPLLWSLVMFMSTMTMIAFPLMRLEFSDDEVGRVLSLLNFSIFAVSFAMQWFVGAVLELYPTADGVFSPGGYRTSMLVITALNAVAAAHLFFCLRRNS
ncbi:MAG: MFS transporter [Synergistaceae bacterium]|jgi:MFS family permease|nr:MFS transporter [Synergistaceae bacterium]